MADNLPAIVMISVNDTIQILENQPVKGDWVPQITAVQFMNRASIAHLSIERALKTLIKGAGVRPPKWHDLKLLYEKLQQLDPESAKYLEEAFGAAVRHYRYNPNAANMTHLQTLESYLDVAGSDRAFQDVRYWELNQSLDEVILTRIYLTLHIELLHALRELLLAPQRSKETVVGRVERVVAEAMFPMPDLSNVPGTTKGVSVQAYRNWLSGFTTRSEALAEAVHKRFHIGDDFMDNIVAKANQQLLQSSDPAVRYFVSSLDVLPLQQRDVVPCVEWWGPEKERYGCVKTPAGTVLGYIDRGLDDLWNIIPSRNGPVGVSAKATTQKDAQCYLANLHSKPAKIKVAGKDVSLRLVGEGDYISDRNYPELMKRWGGKGDDTTWTHKIALWDKDHGIKTGDKFKLTLELGTTGMDRAVHIVEGTVTDVQGHEVYLSGDDIFDVEQEDPALKA